MNWQLPLLLAQDSMEELRARVQASTLDGTTVPDNVLQRPENLSSNPFATEYWFPEQASGFAAEVDYLFMGIFWISAIFFAGIVGTMVYFCLKYRRKGGKIEPQPSPSHNTAVEILWSVLPSILLVWMFYVGAEGFYQMEFPREDAEEIQVIAYQFGWQFIYPDGDTSSELHLVQDKPAILKMQSKDVLHSMYVAAFRQKQDVVPGRYTYAYIEPTKVGQYRLSCNEYCGDGHSKMRTMAEVHVSEEDRKANTEWINAEYTPWENGQRIYQIHCAGCHNVNGQAATGPALNDTWERTATFADGSSAVADSQYVMESILKPSEKIVSGYGAAGSVSKMNSFQGILGPEDINYVIEYLKYLKDPSLVTDAKVGEIEENESGSAENSAASE